MSTCDSGNPDQTLSMVALSITTTTSVGQTPPAGLGRVAVLGRSEVSGTWVKNGVASAATKLVFGHNHGLRATMAARHNRVNLVDLGPWRPLARLPTQ
jgi:hypothetical protein